MKNIILIGMPGCGKSSVGKLIAEKLGLEFIDTDTLCERISGRAISKIFEADGEKAFREIEHEAIMQATKSNGAVIATGGGAVTVPENYQPLKQNGIVIFIDIDPAKLQNGDRPLLKVKTNEQLYNERIELYRKWCDFSVQSDYCISSVADKILKIIKEKGL